MNTTARGLLLIDPNPLERQRLAEALENRGWKVWSVSDGPTAYELYRERPHEIHTALVDLQFPGLEGSRILAELGRIAPALFRCAMSGEVSEYTAAAFRRLTDTPLFPKPVKVEHLDAAMRDPAASAC